MNWYKKAQFVEEFDEDLLEDLDRFEDIKPFKQNIFDGGTYPTEYDLEFMIDSLVDKRGIILTPEQHQKIRDRIKKERETEGYKNRNIYWDLNDILDSIDEN